MCDSLVMVCFSISPVGWYEYLVETSERKKMMSRMKNENKSPIPIPKIRLYTHFTDSLHLLTTAICRSANRGMVSLDLTPGSGGDPLSHTPQITLDERAIVGSAGLEIFQNEVH
jgi:hypothetical protein